MSHCATYWKALNEAEGKLAALESVIAEASAPFEDIRKQYEAAGAARDEYVRLCENGFELEDGRRVWGPDFLALDRLERENGIVIKNRERTIDRIDRHGRILKLDLYSLGLGTVEPLRWLHLEELDVSDNPNLMSLAGLEGMHTLRVLSAWGCGLSTLASLRGLRLEDLDVYSNERLGDLSGLKDMRTLKKLAAFECALTTLEPLRGLRLEQLHVYENKGLKSLAGLEGMTSLELLSAFNCGLTTVKSLKGLALRELFVYGNAWLRDLKGLDGMVTLQKLHACNCGLSKETVTRWKSLFPFAELG